MEPDDLEDLMVLVFPVMMERHHGPEFLLSAKFRGPFAGLWNGLGGHVKEHEVSNVELAACRELFEESGIVVGPDMMRPFCKRIHPGGMKRTIAFSCTIRENMMGIHRPVPGECLGWFGLSDIDNLFLAPNVDWMVRMSVSKTVAMATVG